MPETSGSDPNKGQEAHSKDFHDFLGLMSQFVEKIGSSSGSKPSGDSESGVDMHLKVFQSLNPPIFKGACEPTEAEDWLEVIEKILEGMICPDNRKVILTTFALQGEANRWWRSQQKGRFSGTPSTEISWDDFTEVFRERFIPPSARILLEEKFISLTQGARTVMQYEAEFTTLSRYGADFVGTEARMCHRFLNGLQGHLRLALAPLGIQKFADLVDRACIIENQMQRLNDEQSREVRQQYSGRKRPFEKEDSFKGKQHKFDQKQKFVPQQEKPFCEKCKKRHFGQCLLGSEKCFRCGEIGHKKIDCPLERQYLRGPRFQRESQRYQTPASQQFQKKLLEGPPAGRAKFLGKSYVPQKGDSSGTKNEPVKARVFTLSSKEAKEKEDVVTGMLLIANQFGTVLFDSGASHSFISEDFSVSLLAEFTCLASAIHVSMPSGDFIVANRMCNVFIHIQGRQLAADLIVSDRKTT